MKDNLEIFTNLFKTKNHLLQKMDRDWPSERILFQFAYEDAVNSPISIQAEKFLVKNRVQWPWLKQKNRKKIKFMNPNYATIFKHDAYWQGAELLNDNILIAFTTWSLYVCDLKTGKYQPFNDEDIYKEGTCLYTEGGKSSKFIGCLKVDTIQFVTWHDTGEICLWNIKDKSKKILKGHTAKINDVQLTNSKELLSCSDDHSIRIWDLEKSTSKLLKGHNDIVYGMKFIGENKFISYSKDITFRIWDLKDNSSKPFDQIKIYCDKITNTNEYQEYLKKYNQEWSESNRKLNIPFIDHTRKAQKGIEDILWIGNNKLIVEFDCEIHYFDLETLKHEDMQNKWSNIEANELSELVLLDSKKLSVLHSNYNQDASCFLMINLKDNTITITPDFKPVITNIKALNEHKIIGFNENSTMGGYHLTLYDLNTKSTVYLEGHTEEINSRITEGGIRIISDTKFISFSDSEIRLWDISAKLDSSDILPKIKVEIDVRDDRTNLLILDNRSVIFWAYEYKNNITIYDFLEDSVVKEIEINEEILQLSSVKMSYAISKSDILMIEDDIHGGRLIHINLESNNIIILSDTDEVITHCIKVEGYVNHFITWTNEGIIKIWDMNKIECIVNYIFEGVCEILQINKKNIIAVSKNGKHRVLSLENF